MRKLFSGSRRATADASRIFFATDIHGSEVCFRKFLAAAKAYNVDHLIMGGDITGKFLVPIIREASGSYRARYGDQDYRDLSEAGRNELEQTVRRYGHYPVVGTEEELMALEDEAERERVFREIVYKSVAGWVALADERLAGSGHRLYIAPGNDDFLAIDDALEGSEVVVFAENRRLMLGSCHEMITTGYSNPTPWETERELSEEALKGRLEGMLGQVGDLENLVAVVHSPPYDSGIDAAPALGDNLTLKKQFGGVGTMPVGSTAVREFIEESQPLLALHGHVHEGRGAVTIGRTLCINPGSEYTEGILTGVIVEVDRGRVVSHQLVAG